MPNGLKITCLKDPYKLDPSDTCPVVIWGNYQYWPLSYIDNRVSMCLVAYDTAGRVVGQWEMPGARYVVSAAVDDARQNVTFVGQSNQHVSTTWNTMKNPAGDPARSGQQRSAGAGRAGNTIHMTGPVPQ